MTNKIRLPMRHTIWSNKKGKVDILYRVLFVTNREHTHELHPMHVIYENIYTYSKWDLFASQWEEKMELHRVETQLLSVTELQHINQGYET